MTDERYFLCWPAGKFFWAVLQGPGMLRPGPLPEALYAELADEIPVPIEEVFAVATPTLPSNGKNIFGQLVVCAIRRAELDELVPVARRVVPDSIPPELGVSASAAALNFMVGEYEPREAKVARFKIHSLRGLAVLLVAGLLCAGWSRRASHHAAMESLARDQIAGVMDRAAIGHEPAMPAMFDYAIDAELARARRAAEASGVVAPPPDAALALAKVLAAWPAQVPSKPQSISVTPTAIVASVTFDGDAVAFLGALRPPAGWTLDEPRMNAAGGLTRVSLHFKPSSTAGAGTP